MDAAWLSGARGEAVGALNRRDLVVGTAIALAMGSTFALLSSGLSLIVTFVPGVAVSWLTFVWLYLRRARLPSAAEFLPLFLVALAVQFVHFAEEFLTGFRVDFPLLYGGAPYSDGLFVTFNMVSYAVFVLACILVYTAGLRFLLIPVLFYAVYGATGNAISHTWWSLYLHGYFPGFVTAQLYWVFGPLLLYKLVGGRRDALAIVVAFALVLIPLLTIFASPGPIGGR
jgi:hypothetical protein